MPSRLPTVFCFAGQGAQYFHMAAGLMETQPVFRYWMETGDRIIRDAEGFSILASIYDPTRTAREPFECLAQSHPSLFTVQVALAKTVQSLGVRPDLLLGASLGEWVAMTVAGMVPFDDALCSIARQPALFEASAPPGTLIAVLGPPSMRDGSALLMAETEIAGLTGDALTVLACPATAVEVVIAELDRIEALHIRLPVRFAFHSRWIEPAREAYLTALAPMHFEPPICPVWSSRTAAPIEKMDAPALWRLVREPINLGGAIAALEGQGGACYLDLSPSGTVFSVLQQLLPPSSPSTRAAVLMPSGDNDARLRGVVAAYAG